MNRILESTKFVVDHADFVEINHDRVAEFSKGFDHGNAKHWLSVAPFDLTQLSDEQKLHFLVMFNTLSFSYWGEPKWTVKYNKKSYDGAWGMIVSLGRTIEQGSDILDFAYSANISQEDFQRVLLGNVEIPLFKERWQILREISSNMVTKFDGKVINLLNASKGDALNLLGLIIDNFPSFKDSWSYKGEEIYFSKRAQLLIVDIYQFFNGGLLGSFANIDQITACADYKLPQILRKLGILQYEHQLAHRIDSKIEIAAGAPEEIEIRANTIWAVELIKHEVAKRSPTIRSFEINDHLWLATQEKFPDDRPYHRTRTTAY